MEISTIETFSATQEIQSWLEWAGGKVITLQVQRVRPGSYRSFWPDYPDDVTTAYGYTGEPLRIPAPSAHDIVLMDAILNLIILTPVVLERKVLNARALVNPVNCRHIYSWHRIAKLIRVDDRTVRRVHEKGLRTISVHILPSLILRLRQELEN